MTTYWLECCVYSEKVLATRPGRCHTLVFRPLHYSVPLEAFKSIRCARGARAHVWAAQPFPLCRSAPATVPTAAKLTAPLGRAPNAAHRARDLDAPARRVCASGYSEDERNVLWRLTNQLGGQFTSKMTRSNTHLLVAETVGAKYHHAREFGVVPVTAEWLQECARSGQVRAHLGLQRAGLRSTLLCSGLLPGRAQHRALVTACACT